MAKGTLYEYLNLFCVVNEEWMLTSPDFNMHFRGYQEAWSSIKAGWLQGTWGVDKGSLQPHVLGRSIKSWKAPHYAQMAVFTTPHPGHPWARRRAVSGVHAWWHWAAGMAERRYSTPCVCLSCVSTAVCSSGVSGHMRWWSLKTKLLDMFPIEFLPKTANVWVHEGVPIPHTFSLVVQA